VGIGGESSSRMKDGAFMVLHSGSLEVIHEDRKSKRWIRDVRFSPNSQLLAIASDDGRIFIHETSKFELAATCVSSGSGSSITHIDFSDDGLILQATTVDEELLFFNTTDGSQILQSTSVRDVDWHTHSCVFGWNLQGLYSIKGEEEYPSIQSIAVDPSSSVVVCCDAKGSMRAFNYPSQSPGAQFKSMHGVSTTAHRMFFTDDGQWLILLDSLTRSILQFRVLSMG
jgi:WD40 repeat protein